MTVNWISVEERLPTPLQDVIAYYSGTAERPAHVERGYMFSDESWVFSDLYGPVTHWMPLPEPPQAEDSEDEDNQEGDAEDGNT